MKLGRFRRLIHWVKDSAANIQVDGYFEASVDELEKRATSLRSNVSSCVETNLE